MKIATWNVNSVNARLNTMLEVFKACEADPVCAKALEDQEECISGPGDHLDCFGNFARGITLDGGKPGVGTNAEQCIVNNCSAACGGPGIV